jgi:outer membrane protein OmpA-like peptidoglycan-associated protein
MRRLLRLLLALVALAGGAMPAVGQDGGGGPPASVERVRQRVGAIRGDAPPPVVVVTPGAGSAGATGVTRAELEAFEARLLRRVDRLLRQALAARVPTSMQTFVQDGARYLVTARGDTVRVPPDTLRMPPDTVRLVLDTLRTPPDTVRTTRVVEVREALLETGLFRAFEVNFAFGDSTLAPRAARALDAVGDVLATYPRVQVAVAGHTDAVGDSTYNRRLSEARARVVCRYLTDAFDLDADRLTARGYGEAQPIADNGTPAGRALNRRVEFRVLNPGDALRRPLAQRPSDDDAAPADTTAPPDTTRRERPREEQDALPGGLTRARLDSLVRQALRDELARQAAADSARVDSARADSTDAP